MSHNNHKALECTKEICIAAITSTAHGIAPNEDYAQNISEFAEVIFTKFVELEDQANQRKSD